MTILLGCVSLRVLCCWIVRLEDINSFVYTYSTLVVALTQFVYHLIRICCCKILEFISDHVLIAVTVPMLLHHMRNLTINTSSVMLSPPLPPKKKWKSIPNAYVAELEKTKKDPKYSWIRPRSVSGFGLISFCRRFSTMHYDLDFIRILPRAAHK